MSAVDPQPLSTTPPGALFELYVAPSGSRYHGPGRHAKRAFDIAAVVILIPLLAVPALIIAVIVKITTGGPVLYRHERVGRGGVRFRMLKFRTMYADAHERLHADPALYARYVANDYKLAPADDPRIARCGRFLRATSLDELPQLWHVLTGTMSLVGPRPVVADELGCYGRWVGAYLEAKPGITGRWQSDGRSHIRYPERAMLDADYFANWTFTGDLLIILKTIPAVLRRHGSH